MSSKSQNPQNRREHLSPRSLSILQSTKFHKFIKPAKRINEGQDVPHFLTSRAYGDIGMFVMQLNVAMCPRKSPVSDQIMTWKLDSPLDTSQPVRKLQELLARIDAIIEEAPPDTGPRRFGNVSFRKWYEILESRAKDLLQTYLPPDVFQLSLDSAEGISALDELAPYLLGGFGSSQRLDYGTGHELSFLAFLGGIWKLGGFTHEYTEDGALERSIVLGIIEPYLRVVRRLILTYTLEPAGSHGVWGLDDHSFLPYIFGSSQYCPPIKDGDPMPVEGALPDSPEPSDIAKKDIVDRERKHNMYFAAVGFINDVKTGPFWEHSPMLFDISGVRSGWGKINKGMVKMYNAEVLSKFPVVQHFPFGSLFSWEQDPNAIPAAHSVHTANQPSNRSTTNSFPIHRPLPQEGTRAPWANQASVSSMAPTAAPWSQTQSSHVEMAPNRAPWASAKPSAPGEKSVAIHPPKAPFDGPTKAPWAD